MQCTKFYRGRRLLSDETNCIQCNKSMKPTETDLCDQCSDHLSSLVGSPAVDMYGIPKKERRQ